MQHRVRVSCPLSSICCTLISLGSSLETEPIVVDGSRFLITSNLAMALKSLWEVGVELVWTDRICINQVDGEELDAQIPRMEAIYRLASLTYAWIPAGSDDCTVVQRWISYASGADTGHLSDALRPLEPFLTSAYWHRVWVLQELAASRAVQVVYGTAQFSFEEVKLLVEKLCADKSAKMSTAISALPSAKRGLEHLTNLIDLRNKIQSVTALELVHVLRITRESDATQTKDRLYGLWGLVSFDYT